MNPNVTRLLNELAAQFKAESQPCRKRILLWRYVEMIQFVVCKAHGWSLFQGAPPCDLAPLDLIGELLLSLNQGELPALLMPAKRPGRRAGRRKQFFWANAAALIDVLMQRFGKSEEGAAKAVARQLHIRKLLFDAPRSHSPAWKLLQTWRDKIRNGEKGRLARAWYDHVLLFAPLYENERELFEGVLDPDRLPLEPLL
jgi:hypothetical protein